MDTSKNTITDLPIGLIRDWDKYYHKDRLGWICLFGENNDSGDCRWFMRITDDSEIIGLYRIENCSPVKILDIIWNENNVILQSKLGGCSINVNASIKDDAVKRKIQRYLEPEYKQSGYDVLYQVATAVKNGGFKVGRD